MIHVILGSVTAVAADTFAAQVLASGDSATVFSGKGEPRLVFVAGFAESSTGANSVRARIRSNDYGVHDPTNGFAAFLTAKVTTAGRRGVKFFRNRPSVKPNGVLTLEGYGGTGAGESAAYLTGIQYDPRSQPVIQLGDVEVVTVTVTQSSTGGVIDTPTWSNLVSLPSGVLRANTKYAVLGYNIRDTGVGAIRFSSPDFNGLFPGGLANDDAAINEALGSWDTNDWFEHDFKCNDIPIFNSNNGLQTQICAAGDANIAAIVDIYMATALTKPKTAP